MVRARSSQVWIRRSQLLLIALAVVLLLPAFAISALAQQPNPDNLDGFEMMPSKNSPPEKAPATTAGQPMKTTLPQPPALEPVAPPSPTPAQSSSQFEILVFRKVCLSASDYARAEAKLNDYGRQGYQVVGVLLDRTGAMTWTLQRRKAI